MLYIDVLYLDIFNSYGEYVMSLVLYRRNSGRERILIPLLILIIVGPPSSCQLPLLEHRPSIDQIKECSYRNIMSGNESTPFSFHCMICFEEFHPDDRYPVVLPCGPTYVWNVERRSMNWFQFRSHHPCRRAFIILPLGRGRLR
jgi:hypothetical protein